MKISWSYKKFKYGIYTHLFKYEQLTIVATKVKDPINAAINTVSATDASGSPITAINIE